MILSTHLIEEAAGLLEEVESALSERRAGKPDDAGRNGGKARKG